MFAVLEIPKNFGVDDIKEFNHNPDFSNSRTFKSLSNSVYHLQNNEVKGNDDNNINSYDSYNSQGNASITNRAMGSQVIVSDGEINLSRSGDRYSSQPQIYQQFLQGNNIFDQFIAQYSKRRGKTESSKAEESHHAREPVLTSCSLNLARYMGRCLQIMESLEPIQDDAFQALEDGLFLFFISCIYMVWCKCSKFFQTT